MRHFTCVRCKQPASRSPQTHADICIPCTHDHGGEGRKAINKVQRARKAGQIQSASNYSCVDCGNPARDYDHRDYTKPLDVVPVCRPCNQKRGLAYDSVYRPGEEAK